MISRADIVSAARECLGTAFHHRGRTAGVGLDCVGLVIYAARRVGAVSQDFDIPPYTLHPDGRTLVELCERYMQRVAESDIQAGDVIAVAIDIDPQHLGIVGNHPYGGLSIIHATNKRGIGKTVETQLVFNRAQKFVAAYALRGVA